MKTIFGGVSGHNKPGYKFCILPAFQPVRPILTVLPLELWAF